MGFLGLRGDLAKSPEIPLSCGHFLQPPSLCHFLQPPSLAPKLCRSTAQITAITWFQYPPCLPQGSVPEGLHCPLFAPRGSSSCTEPRHTTRPCRSLLRISTSRRALKVSLNFSHVFEPALQGTGSQEGCSPLCPSGPAGGVHPQNLTCLQPGPELHPADRDPPRRLVTAVQAG